ncbi:hypothetical protein UlMin_040175 [Ulmus minor]
MEGLKLRLVFQDRNILSKSQRKEGLKRSWILMKPHHDTISDFAAYLLYVFDLDDACPHGLVLSMDGFALPPFESTSILKDNDIICVKKKQGVTNDVLQVCDGKNTCELEGIGDEQPANAGMKLLANEEFELETGGYGSESEEDDPDDGEDELLVDDKPEKKTVSKKRKASEKLQNSKRKRNKLASSIERSVAQEDVQNDVQLEPNESSHQLCVLPKKSPVQEDLLSEQDKPDNSSAPEIDDRTNNITTPSKNKRRKKNNLAKNRVHSGAQEEVQNDVQIEQNDSSHQLCVLPQKSPFREDKSSESEQDEPDYSSTPENDEKTNNIATPAEKKRSCEIKENDKRSVVSSGTLSRVQKSTRRSAQRKKMKRRWLREHANDGEKEIQENGKRSVDSSGMPDGVQKSISRSARRKKSQKRQLREHATNGEETPLIKTDNQRSSSKVETKYNEEHQQADESSNDEENTVVPVVISPGHIRFEPLRKVNADQPTQSLQYEAPMNTFQWNGTTSKKKGQKWGKENNTFCKRNDQKTLNQDSSEVLAIEEERPTKVTIDFEKLQPCTTLPKEGDQVAYRLLELSSSWTPELCSFRVGKVLKYNPVSDRITLIQVPEYPIVSEKNGDEESEAQPEPETSIYAEDGSLEIEYSSLVDVRILKLGNSNTSKTDTAGVSQVTMRDQNNASSFRANSYEKTRSPVKVNGKSKWDELSEGFSPEEIQMAQENGWNKKWTKPAKHINFNVGRAFGGKNGASRSWNNSNTRKAVGGQNGASSSWNNSNTRKAFGGQNGASSSWNNSNTRKAFGGQNGASSLWNKSNTAKAVGGQNGASSSWHNSNTAKAVGGQDAASSSWHNSIMETQTPTQENGKGDAWDEIAKTLNAKKAQLSQEDNWNKNREGESSSRSSWSNRGLRGSALGPTIARLRSQNEL